MIPKITLSHRCVVLYAAALLAALASQLGAQTSTAPDFNGRWKLIEYVAHEGGGTPDPFREMVLEIRQQSSELKILVTLARGYKKQPARWDSAEFVFYTDRRGEKNGAVLENWPQNGTFESVTTWRENKLVTSFKEQRTVANAMVLDSVRNDEWRLEANGQNLVLRTVKRNWLSGGSGLYMSDPSISGVSSGGTGVPRKERRKFVFRKLA